MNLSILKINLLTPMNVVERNDEKYLTRLVLNTFQYQK